MEVRMNKVFDEIIKELQSRKDRNYNIWKEYKNYISYGLIDGFKQSIDIVREIAEKYNNELATVRYGHWVHDDKKNKSI